jgi:hypothetical protein
MGLGNSIGSGKRAPRNVATLAALALIGIVLAACGAGKTMVMEASSQKVRADSVALIEGNSTALCPPDVVAAFKSKLTEKIYQPGTFSQGSDVTLTYRFVQFTTGDRFQRWFFGGIGNAGEGSMTIEAVYTDKSGKQIGKIMSEGKIGSGFFGGSMDDALDKAANEVAQYTLVAFR